MKLCWTAAVGILVATTARVAIGDVKPIKSPEGHTLAVIVACDTCQTGTEHGKACPVGAEKGWLKGVPCGECLLQANAQEPPAYPYDLQLKGKLADTSGAPVKERFVRLFFPNGWKVRARTSDDGSFHLMLGATADKKGKQPLVVDLGTYVDQAKGTDQFALFILSESYRPCAEQPATPAAKTPKKQTQKR